MALISWTDDLSVNVKEIDDQHKKIVDMMNDLNDAMSQGKGKDVIGKIISGLADYATEHFALEERYFDKFQYPGTLLHKRSHQAFVEKVSEFYNDYQSGNVRLSVDVRIFLKDWLINHIQIEDKKYTRCFNKNGIY